MFIDEVTIDSAAGNGGNGMVAFYPQKKGPCGGPGGDGGNVYVHGDAQMSDLHRYAGAKVWKAEDGGRGQSNNKNGKDGEDLVINVPTGTFLTDTATGHEIEIVDTDTQYLLARGGRGGRGNTSFATSTHQVPREAEAGEPGEKRTYHVVLKLIADFGLIGLPNAGKSSLLNELTRAHVKTAGYPFTTLEPNLGVFERAVIADIPGLIEGASEGKGLGHTFLKHIEKVPVILHCIASDSADPQRDYAIVLTELEKYNEALLQKKQIILLTKSDLVSEEKMKHLIRHFQKDDQVYPISIYHPKQFETLQQLLRTLV